MLIHPHREGQPVLSPPLSAPSPTTRATLPPPLQILLPQPDPLRPTLSMKSFSTAPDCSGHFPTLDTHSIYFTQCTFCLSVHSPERCSHQL